MAWKSGRFGVSGAPPSSFHRTQRPWRPKGEWTARSPKIFSENADEARNMVTERHSNQPQIRGLGSNEAAICIDNCPFPSRTTCDRCLEAQLPLPSRAFRLSRPTYNVRLLLAGGNTPPRNAHHKPSITHFLPSPSDQRPPHPKPRGPCLPFPPHHLFHTPCQDWRAPVVSYPLPPFAAASDTVTSHVASQSLPPCPPSPRPYTPVQEELLRCRGRLATPSPTAGDGHSAAFRGQIAGILHPPAAAATDRKTSRGCRGGRRRRGAAREEAMQEGGKGELAMALGAEQQASAWSTIDAQDSIRLLRIIIAIIYQVGREVSPIVSDPSLRRLSYKKT